MNGCIRKLFFLWIGIGLIAGCTQQNKQSNENNQKTKIDPLLARLDELNDQIKKDSTNSDFYYERALFYYDNEEYNEALKDIIMAKSIDSTYAGYYVTLADIYIAMGKLPVSIEALNKALVLDGENIDALFKLAEINIIYRDYKSALEYIDKVIKIDQLEAKSYFLRGVILLENGDTVRGIRNFQKAIDVDQDYFDAHLQLGMLYADKKNGLAVDYLNNALNIDPENKEVSYYLGLYYQEIGNYDKAIQTYNTILDIDPKFYFALYNIGYINLVYLKDFNAAIDYFNKTIEINPEYADAFYNRGFAYELLMDVENSQKDYKRTLELNPNYEKAIEGLNRIDDFMFEKSTDKK